MNCHVLSLAPDRTPAERYGACVDRLTRVTGFIDCLRDTIEMISDSLDPSLATRLWVCDFITGEVGAINATLREIGDAIAAERGMGEGGDAHRA